MTYMRNEKMYMGLSNYYDASVSWKNYRAECALVHKLIKDNKESKGRDLLDVACGTGNHIRYLKNHYRVTGIDKNAGMLRTAGDKFPGVEFVQADMTSFSLDRKFDAVICLYASIAYARTHSNLLKVTSNISDHLKKGGVSIIEPFMSKNEFVEGKPFASFVNEPALKIARMNVNRRRAKVAILEFHFLVATNAGVKHFRDRHEVGLFDRREVKQAMEDSGLHTRFVKAGFQKDRGLFIGVKQ
jgi:ubiquinone/menaquinone biosynthesis C-methylase UbiE